MRDGKFQIIWNLTWFSSIFFMSDFRCLGSSGILRPNPKPCLRNWLPDQSPSSVGLPTTPCRLSVTPWTYSQHSSMCGCWLLRHLSMFHAIVTGPSKNTGINNKKEDLHN
jgi:hypothetical protein